MIWVAAWLGVGMFCAELNHRAGTFSRSPGRQAAKYVLVTLLWPLWLAAFLFFFVVAFIIYFTRSK
jgi:hypothetical protein